MLRKLSQREFLQNSCSEIGSKNLWKNMLVKLQAFYLLLYWMLVFSQKFLT